MGGTTRRSSECYAIINVILGGEKQQEEEALNDYWGCTRQQEGITNFHKFQDFSSVVYKEEEEAAVIMDNKQLPITTTTSTSNSSIEESIRKTMQMHEDIFQHQVKELHRLYSLQKTIMKEESMKKKQTGILLWNQYTTSNRPPPPPNRIEEDEVELTLSIGVSDTNNKKKPKKMLCTSDHISFNSSLSIESDRGGGGDNSGSTTETSNKADKKRPFWLVPSLD